MLPPPEQLVVLDDEVQVGAREVRRGLFAKRGRIGYLALAAALAASTALAFLVLSCGAAIRGRGGPTDRLLSSKKQLMCTPQYQQNNGESDDEEHDETEANTSGASSPEVSASNFCSHRLLLCNPPQASQRQLYFLEAAGFRLRVILHLTNAFYDVSNTEVQAQGIKEAERCATRMQTGFC